MKSPQKEIENIQIYTAYKMNIFFMSFIVLSTNH